MYKVGGLENVAWIHGGKKSINPLKMNKLQPCVAGKK
jgi:hypothetical protein